MTYDYKQFNALQKTFTLVLDDLAKEAGVKLNEVNIKVADEELPSMGYELRIAARVRGKLHEWRRNASVLIYGNAATRKEFTDEIKADLTPRKPNRTAGLGAYLQKRGPQPLRPMLLPYVIQAAINYKRRLRREAYCSTASSL